MEKKYDILVFVGRFQPFHCGHKIVVDKALELADNVLILVGGRNQPRSVRNPWTFEERKQMIMDAYADEFKPDWEVARTALNILPIDDHTYNDDAWVKQVQETIADAEFEIYGSRKAWSDKSVSNKRKIGLIGCEKDGTSYYLKLFPTFGSESVEFLSPINATDIRRNMFDEDFDGWQMHEIADNILPTPIAKKLWSDEPYMPLDTWNDLVTQYERIKNYKRVWGYGPFLTADSLVEVGGHILVVERGGDFGKGLLALPGGFVNEDETFANAGIRELREETRLKVPDPVLRGSVVATQVFDSPHRSDRGRIITVCQHIKLQNETKLPVVKGSDDAAKAFWLPISQISAKDFFEDHAFIIRKMLGI